MLSSSQDALEIPLTLFQIILERKVILLLLSMPEHDTAANDILDNDLSLVHVHSRIKCHNT